MMKCPKCQTQIAASAKFCTSCGTNLEEAGKGAKPECPQCGGELKAGAKFCPDCGAAQAGAASARAHEADFVESETTHHPQAQKRNLVYMLLPLAFVVVLVPIFYLLTSNSQNLDTRGGANTAQNAAPDMERMMPVFRTIDSLRAVLQENPADTTALLVLGEMFEMAGKFDQARDYYTKYLEINPDRTDITLRVLGTLISEHKHEEEDELLARILQAVPDDPHTLLYIGDLYERAGKTDKARDFYNRSLAVKPGQVDIFMRQAGMLFAEENYTAAEELLEKVLEKQPNNPHALYNYALALHLHGDHEKALEYWQKAIASDPSGEIGMRAREALVSFESIKESN
jgi:cytochrome c-type biogenesis protein CcmH/NrfG